MPTVLCIDDNRESLQIRELLLETQGYAVLTVLNVYRKWKVAFNPESDKIHPALP